MLGGEKLAAFLDTLPTDGDTVQLIVKLNEAVNAVTKYVIREEAGIWDAGGNARRRAWQLS